MAIVTETVRFARLSDPHAGTGVLTLNLTCDGSDIDGNGNVDLDDYAHFAPCLLGPGGGIGPGCGCLDLDQDGDVTVSDFRDYQSEFTGN